MTNSSLDNLRHYGYAPRDARNEKIMTALIAMGMLVGFVLMAMMGVLD